MAFPSLLNARVLQQLASLSALLIRRQTKGASSFLIVGLHNEYEASPGQYEVCVWYIEVLLKPSMTRSN